LKKEGIEAEKKKHCLSLEEIIYAVKRV